MLRQQITEAMKTAMRARDERTLATVRMILAALKQKDIEARPGGNTEGIPDDQILAMLQGMIKQRRESIALYAQGGRDDLVAREEQEIAVIARFLPEPMGEAEVEAAIRAAIEETGAAGLRDMGRVMALLKERHAGRIDMAQIGPRVKAALS